MMASLAGSLYVHFTSFIDPSVVEYLTTSEWIMIVLFGGRDSVVGLFVSSAILLSAPEALRAVNEYRTIIYGFLILITLNFKPNGLFGRSRGAKPLYKIIADKLGSLKNTTKAGGQ